MARRPVYEEVLDMVENLGCGLCVGGVFGIPISSTMATPLDLPFLEQFWSTFFQPLFLHAFMTRAWNVSWWFFLALSHASRSETFRWLRHLTAHTLHSSLSRFPSRSEPMGG